MLEKPNSSISATIGEVWETNLFQTRPFNPKFLDQGNMQVSINSLSKCKFMIFSLFAGIASWFIA